jgi:MFS family permease
MSSPPSHWALPPGTQPYARLLLMGRGIRAFGDGYVSLLLPFYLTMLGYGAAEVGLLVTATMVGSGAITLTIGMVAHRYGNRTLLLLSAAVMTFTGVAMASLHEFWPLLLVAFVGTVNPSGGDVSMFGPLEQAMLAEAPKASERTTLFARYSLTGALVAAFGAQFAGLPGLLSTHAGYDEKVLIQLMFVLYGVLGLMIGAIYRRLPRETHHGNALPRARLGKSKRIVYKLSALFTIDSFAGGFAVQSLIALWLHQRYQLSLVTISTIFFWLGLMGAMSFLVAARIAKRIGLVNTMVWTHVPANIFLLLVPFMPNLTLALVFLTLRFALSQMDVPTRTSYVMAVVTPEERASAASITAVPRSLGAAVSPAIAGQMLAISSFGWPLVVCGALKLVYDVLLLQMFSHIKPPEEGGKDHEKITGG